MGTGSLGSGGDGKEKYYIFSTENCHFCIHKNRSKSHGRVTVMRYLQSLGVTILRLPSSITVCMIFIRIILLLFTCVIIIKCLDPLRAKKTFIRKKLGHTAVTAIKASPVTL